MAKISEPFYINKLRIANRFVAEPMLTDTLDPEGYVNERYLKTMAETAAGGWGLVIVQASTVHLSGQVVRNELAIHDDTCVPGLYELSETIKKYGPRVAIQLFHAGAIAHPKVLRTKDKIPVAPSPMPSFLNPSVMARELKDTEIEELIDCYGAAAARAKEAGFEAVEVHACHGSLPHQFLSPRLNKRTDEWGKNRLLFLTKIIESIRKNVGPDFPIISRISVDEHYTPGFSVEDTVKYTVPALEKAGVNAIDCSSGSVDASGIWVIQPLYMDQGCLVKEARRVKEVAKVPVGTVGKIMDPKMAERIIAEGSADWVGLGRPSWADPHYAKKTLEGKYEEVRKCIGCDYCTWTYIILNVPARCSVNWEFGIEVRVPEIKKVEEPKNVLIVGGGVAGMEAARILALRGHNVMLYEKKDALGGLVNIASDIPYLYTLDLRHMVDWLTTQVKKLEIEVKLGEEVTPELVDKLNPDVAVIATGSIPHIPDIQGIKGPNVITLDDYLWQKPELGKEVVVLGGTEGAEVSVSLARQGKKVTLVSEAADVVQAPYLYNPIRVALLKSYLAGDGVKMITDAKVTEVAKDGVKIVDKEGKERFIKADNVISAFGRKAFDELAKALEGKVPELYKIGDCVRPSYIFRAIDDANHVARTI